MLFHLVEKGFSAVNQILTKNEKQMEVEYSGDLWFLLSNLKPNIVKLIIIIFYINKNVTL